MFFAHSKNKKVRKTFTGVVKRFPESLVNPLYKPRTLSELKALMNHTGINPAPVQLREGVKEIDGLDSMDMPPIPIGGDSFEHIREGKAIVNEMSRLGDSIKQNQPGNKPADPVQPTTE